MNAWRMLEARVPGSISRDQLDQALAHYAYGLTQPFYTMRSAREQVDAIILLLVKVLPEERATWAIHSKLSDDDGFLNTCASLAGLGERDALAIINLKSRDPQGDEAKQQQVASVGTGADEEEPE